MRYLWNEFITHWRETFGFWKYSLQLLLALSLLILNYSLNLEDGMIDPIKGNSRILWMGLLSFIPFLISIGLLVLCGVKINLRSPGFWIISLICFAFLAFHRGNHFYSQLAIEFIEKRSLQIFYIKVIKLPMSFFLALALGAFLFIFQRKELTHFYGISGKFSVLRPYLILLLLMSIPIAIASFQQDFQAQYPYFKNLNISRIARLSDHSDNFIIASLETAYLSRFLFVEFFFRGLLIFALVRYLGNEVVLPVAIAYCILHFGKPWLEALSSLFGGYILGVLALRTRSIFGGVILHMGIAFLMELFAFGHLWFG